MQAVIEERISYLEQVTKEVKIVANKKKGDVVVLGSEVTIQKDKQSEPHTYTIVGSEEADIHRRKLSYLSPLGDALMGKTKGDSFSFDTPSGAKKYKVLLVK